MATRKNRQFTDIDKTIYRLGYSHGFCDGERQLAKNIEKLKKVHLELLQRITTLSRKRGRPSKSDHQSIETNALLRKVNNRLFEFLLQLDSHHPLTGTKEAVIMPMQLITKILEKIPNKPLRHYYLKKIQTLVTSKSYVIS